MQPAPSSTLRSSVFSPYGQRMALAFVMAGIHIVTSILPTPPPIRRNEA
jgi:hypothetical protein